MAKKHITAESTTTKKKITSNGVTTILLDLDGTLRHTVPNGQDMIMDMAESFGAVIDPDLRRQAIQWLHQYWAVSECLLNDVKTYGRENQEFWLNYARRQLEAVHIPTHQAQEWAALIHGHMLEQYQPQDLVPSDVLPTLASLRQAGYTLGLVTNRQNPIDEYLQQLSFSPYLDFWVYAGEIGAWKPQPEIFHYALGQANARPSQAVYVGDNYYSDVLGAQNAAIQPLLLDPDGIFPQAECPVIHCIAELTELLLIDANNQIF